MNASTAQPSSRWRLLWLIALVGLPLLGWHGVLDYYSAKNIDASLYSAGAIYGTARGINALVSLLQGTELNVPFLTFSIGEVLDPVNDLIERFSDVILLALGSLALQKILLTIVSARLFNILLSVIAACTAVSLLPGRSGLSRALLRTFLLIAFVRFSLGIVVLANGWIDAAFLDEGDQRRHAAMEKFQGELREVDTLTQKQKALTASIEEIREAIADNERRYREQKHALDRLAAQISADEAHLRQLEQQAGMWCNAWDVLQLCPAEVKQKKADLNALQEKLEAGLQAQEKLADSISDQQDEIACLEMRERGENCHFWDRIPDAPNLSVVRQRLNDINANIKDFVDNTINLLVSVLLKTVGIPLLFIYLLLKLVRMNWDRI